MTTSLQLYQAVLYYLNRYSAPDFDVADFRFFVNEAVEQWLKKELEQFELTQVVTDQVRVLIVQGTVPFNADETTNLNLATLPIDYRHLIRTEVKLFYKVASLSYAINSLRKVIAKRITGDNWAYVYDNYYLKPVVTDADCTLYARAIGDKLNVLYESPGYPETTVNVREANIEYIRKPVAITLTDDYVSSTLEFPEDVNRDIARICAELFLRSKNISK